MTVVRLDLHKRYITVCALDATRGAIPAGTCRPRPHHRAPNAAGDPECGSAGRVEVASGRRAGASVALDNAPNSWNLH
jgi:hypothetical protein